MKNERGIQTEPKSCEKNSWRFRPSGSTWLLCFCLQVDEEIKHKKKGERDTDGNENVGAKGSLHLCGSSVTSLRRGRCERNRTHTRTHTDSQWCFGEEQKEKRSIRQKTTKETPWWRWPPRSRHKACMRAHTRARKHTHAHLIYRVYRCAGFSPPFTGVQEL